MIVLGTHSVILFITILEIECYVYFPIYFHVMHGSRAWYEVIGGKDDAAGDTGV